MATAKKKTAAPVAAPAALVEIDRIAAQRLTVPIVGTAPLIMHRFSEKAKKKMLDNMQGIKAPKEIKNPDAEYEAAFYRLKGDTGYGLPIMAFKLATVGAARFYGKDVKMTELRQFLFFHGVPGEGQDAQQLTPIHGDPVMREDAVPVGRGGTDLRYRPMFNEWTTDLEITYVSSALSEKSVLSLIDAGGLGVGVGEWRPERRGDFGTYKIDMTRDIVREEG